MSDKPKITFRKNGDGYVTNEEVSSINVNYLMKELEKHISREKKIKEILEIDDEQ